MKLPINKIKSNPNNPRLIKDDKFNKLVASLKDFPIMAKKLRKVVVDEDNVILGGNMRFKAIKEAGMKEVYVEYFTREDAEENNRLAKELDPEHVDKTYEEQCREFVIKDNVSGGEWDWDILANSWDAEELDAWGLDTPDDWCEEEVEVEEDEAPEVSDEPPVSKLGEIYQLGRHRVMCGDSSNADNTGAVFGSERNANSVMVFTDPPYNVGYSYSEYDDNKTRQEYINFLKATIPQPPIVEKAIVNNGNKKVLDMIEAFGEPKHIGCWTKLNAMSPSSISSFSVWEPVFFYGSIKRRKGNDIFDYPIGKQQDTGGHTCPKPLKMCVDIIREFNEGELVYDPFLGSGSTLIACEQTDRTCYGMELDPKYVDVIRKRYHKFVTGSEEGWQDGTKAV